MEVNGSESARWLKQTAFTEAPLFFGGIWA